MNELDIINLYDSSNNEKNDHFNNNISSNLRVVSNYDEETSNYEWLTIMEDICMGTAPFFIVFFQ